MGDYGHFAASGDFIEGNVFAEVESLFSKANIAPRQHKISQLGGDQRESDIVRAYHDSSDSSIELYKPLGLSLPSNDDFRSFLVSLSTRLTNRYLVTMAIQCPPDQHWSRSSTLYTIAKPFVWHRNERAGSVARRAMR